MTTIFNLEAGIHCKQLKADNPTGFLNVMNFRLELKLMQQLSCR